MEPLVKGEWLRAGTHGDLIGAYTPEMRETDSAVISRGQVFVDTLAGARSEAGDLLHAVEEGAFDFDEVESDLCALVSGQHVGRASQDEITIFKSVGAACEDLAAAILAYERLS
jgi:ornithine cyclodeaminase